MSENYYAVILAGGTGTRLWPISRESKPKQFQTFGGKITLFQQTASRCKQAVAANNLYIVTTDNLVSHIVDQLDVSLEQIIIEPSARNTAAAVALATEKIFRSNPDAVIGVFPSDHYIGKEKEFSKIINQLYSSANQNIGTIYTIGINPTEPNTGYGYIKIGNKNSDDSYAVEQFIEKPSLEKATEYFNAWEYLWNGGFYFFSAKVMLSQLKKYQPKLLNNIKKYLESSDQNFYDQIEKLPIDKAVAEHLSSHELAVYPADIDWSDLGVWTSIAKNLQKGDLASHVSIGSKNLTVLPHNRVIATVGVENLVIVDTPDAVLIVRSDAVQDVKQVIDELKQRRMDKFV